MDPSDPSGNTVYVGGACGGVWKTTDFLTTSPNGPTWIPLTNFGPNAAINISSIAIFPRNDDPNQSIIIAATGGTTSGQQTTNAPGVGFLISMDGGVTWNLYDSTVNVSGTTTKTTGSGNLLPIDSAARDREFVGTTAYQVAVDPQLTPTGQVIIYAALSGTNGGIWREREHRPDLDPGPRRQRDLRRPRPEQRHRPRPGHRHRRPRATSRSSTPASPDVGAGIAGGRAST